MTIYHSLNGTKMSVLFWVTAIFLCYVTMATDYHDTGNIHWTFTFTTATDNIAASDANQHLILRGTLGNSHIISLNEVKDFSRFEKGRTDIFNVTIPDIGLLRNVTFWNDKTGRRIGPIWNIKKAELFDREHNKTYQLHQVRVQSILSTYYIPYEISTVLTTEMSTTNPSTEPTFFSTEITEEITTEPVEPTTVELTTEPSKDKIEMTTSRFEETTTPEMCLCKCHIPVNRTKEEEETYLKELTKELSIPKKNMSSYIRKKISIPDYRISAQAAGYIGIVFIILPFFLIVAADLIKLVAYCTKSK